MKIVYNKKTGNFNITYSVMYLNCAAKTEQEANTMQREINSSKNYKIIPKTSNSNITYSVICIYIGLIAQLRPNRKQIRCEKGLIIHEMMKAEPLKDR